MKFTEDDVTACWHYHAEYLANILNGEYSVDSAREDLKSLVGSKLDPRTKQLPVPGKDEA